MTRLRLLALARPGPVLDMLAHLGHQWDVVGHGRRAITEPWLLARELPASMHPVRWAEARARLERGAYDAVVLQQVRELVEVRTIAAAVPIVLHAKPCLEAAFGISAHLAAGAIEPDRRDTVCVFDSHPQRRLWAAAGIGGEVIAPGLDAEHYGPYDGSTARILTLGSLQAELPAWNGTGMLERLTAGLPLTVLGFSPGLGLTRPWLPRRERLEALRMHRLCVNVSVQPVGDAAGPHVLEAMASGVPVVTLADPVSPVAHGVDGFVGEDPGSLRPHILELLEDRDLAVRLGRAARTKVEHAYPMARFVGRWNALLSRLVGASGAGHARLTRISA